MNTVWHSFCGPPDFSLRTPLRTATLHTREYVEFQILAPVESSFIAFLQVYKLV